MTWSERLGRVGIWRGYKDVDAALARTVEDLGYGTVWQGGSPGSEPLTAAIKASAQPLLMQGAELWAADSGWQVP